MCGRYYVDDETAREIEKLVRQVGEKLRTQGKRRDVNPGQPSLILLPEEGQIRARELAWGFPLRERKGIIFNARSESAWEKKAFRDSVAHRRCVIPAGGFYEWDGDKNKSTFRQEGGGTMFMAGFYKEFGGGARFVVLTTEANESMKPVHERMPLVLERGEIGDWLLSRQKAEALLHKVPPMLERFGHCQRTLFS